MSDLIYKTEVFQLFGHCMDIHRELGKGYDEVVYKDALVVELSRASIPFVQEKRYEVLYKGDELYYLEASTPITAGPSVGIGSSGSNPMLSAPSPLPLNTWSHLAVTYDGSQVTMYVNGVVVASVNQAFQGLANNQAFLLLQSGCVFNVANYGAGSQPVLDDTALVDDHDAIGPHRRRQAVGHDDGGPPLEQRVEGRLHLRLGLEVEVRRGLVEHEHTRPGEERARERDELPLARRQ